MSQKGLKFGLNFKSAVYIDTNRFLLSFGYTRMQIVFGRLDIENE